MLSRLPWSTPLLLLVVVVAAWQYPSLPDIVVSHWGFDGPDGWAPKRQFVPVVVGAALGLHLLLGWLSGANWAARYSNFPNKSYWLAPERAASTWERMAGYVDATLALMHVLMLTVLHLSAQMSGAPVLVPIPLAAAHAIFLTAIVLCCVVLPVWFLLGFRLPAAERRRRRRG